MQKVFFLLFFFLFFRVLGFSSNNIKTGADQSDIIISQLKNKSVALVVNQTSCLTDGTHLLDKLLFHKVKVKKIMAPEHGFRGEVEAGAAIINGKDVKTGLPIVSLYGKNKKPTPEMLENIDVVIFDIQDVGARFYTYISTMHYVMEACAENNKELIILDRPNPHDYIDGPVLESRYKSFLGIHPIPVLHGLTVGELAGMINGEKWLSGQRECNIKVVKVAGWKHGDPYSLPIKPSPNLPNDQSIKLYASLCFFEATAVSVGRGTGFPFQVIGFPDPKYGNFTFTPKALPGYDSNPLQKDKICYGVDLRNEKPVKGLTLSYFINFYKKSGLGSKFFKSPQFMNLLAGNSKLQQQIIAGRSEDYIRQSWEEDLNKYKQIRKKYLLYEDNK